MDSLFEYNEWFATMQDDGNQEENQEGKISRHEQEEHERYSPTKMRGSPLLRSSSFYDPEAGVYFLGNTDENDNEEDPSLTDTTLDCSEETDEDCSSEDGTGMTTNMRRRRCLTFNSKVEVREYCITIGDHPLCSDALSLSLDWSHAPAYCKDIALSQNRGYFYQPPRRLCQKDRRQRLVKVASFTDETLDTLLGSLPAELATPMAGLSLAKRMLLRLQQSLLSLEHRFLDSALEEQEEDFNWSDEIVQDEQQGHMETKEDIVLVWEQSLDVQPQGF